MTPDYDVIVVGSGAGGAASAWALSDAGLRVLVLEAGPAYDLYKDYRLDREDWERSGFPHKIQTADRVSYAQMQLLDDRWQGLRSWNRVRGLRNLGQRRAVDGYERVIGLGGTTLYYTGEAHRLHPDAMAMKSRFSQAADWPITYDELEPFYTKAEKLLGVAGEITDEARWRSEPFPLPAHEQSYATQVLARGFAARGANFGPNSVAVPSRDYDNRPACNYCNNCNRGCPRGDKGTADVTFLPKARKTGLCEIITEAPVVHLEAGEADRISAVVYNKNGVEHRVAVPLIVLACGAIETPRLLLSSIDGRNPNGLANESGQVGRNFMETILWTTVGLHPEQIGSHRGYPSDAICWDYNRPDAIAGVVGGCRFSPGVAESNLVGPINYAARVVGGWGKPHKQAMRDTFGRAMALTGIGESLPNDHSYVDLDPDQMDSMGRPAARIHSHLTDMDLNRLRFMAKFCRETLAAAGVTELVEEFGTGDVFSASHVFGTCRMGNDPESSVVNRYGRSHRWGNLFICDGSVFPSSGGGESPALTINALAIRTAEHIAKTFGSNSPKIND